MPRNVAAESPSSEHSSRPTVEWNQKAIDALPIPPKGQRDTYEHPKVRGLLVVIGPTGKRLFYLHRRINGTPTRYRIREANASDAYKKAKKLLAKIELGEDPAKERREDRQIPTLADYWTETFEPTHVAARLRPSSQRQYRETWETHILPTLGDRRLHEISRADVRQLHAAIGSKGKKRTANLAIAILRTMLNRARDLELVTSANPCDRIQMFKETKRERYLSYDEIARLYSALEEDANERGDWTWHDFFKLCLLTGARKGNVMSMRWADIDLANRRWKIPSEMAKTGRLYLVSLAPGAVTILQQRKSQAAEDAVYVFPGRPLRDDQGNVAPRHLTEVKSHWNRALRRAKIEDLRIHDLRHTAASLMANTGASLQVIGQQLGHANVQTTERYSHLVEATVQAAVDAAMEGIGAKKIGDNS